MAETAPPLIGLTTYGRDEENRFALPAEYVDAVRRAGGMPILIPPGEAHLTHILAHLAGLILTGGGDLDPVLYNSNGHATIYMVDSERDATEMALTRYSLETGLPTLGICRGTQVINVTLGGTLIEHLPDEVGDDVAHRLPPRNPTRHPVRVRSGSRLAAILTGADGAAAPLDLDVVETASWHHQAIRQPAPALDVVAHAPDGTIEAIELPDHPWLLAVQWHPELTAATDPVQQRLFDALVRVASRRAHAGRSGEGPIGGVDS